MTLFLCLCMASNAKVRMSNVCSDGMVLQQNSKVLLWGTAEPREKITVTPSWNGTAYNAKADSEGRWEVKVETPAAGYTEYTLTVSGKEETITVNDILIGEVWLASGQSNMEMPMRGFYNSPVENALEYISGPAATEKIRMFTVPIKQSYEPLAETDAKWLGAQSSTIPDMSATAYFFARKLNETLDVPVGIVSCAYGGARIESWTPKEILETYPDEDLSRETIEAMTHYHRPYLAYNAMLCPVKGYTIKGFIWYQGCSNVGKHEQFVERMNNMILHWRQEWKDTEGKLPFYMVEIAPFNYNSTDGVSYSSLLREAQHEAASTIPNCGIVGTNDLVYSHEKTNIHPAKKKEVGDRLACLALNRNYGLNRIACNSPEAVRCFVDETAGWEIYVEMSNVPNGLNRWDEIAGLEAAGADGIFHPVTFASYEWDRNGLRIRCDRVSKPTQVRYGWGDFNPGNLKSAEGLPVLPFWIKL